MDRLVERVIAQFTSRSVGLTSDVKSQTPRKQGQQRTKTVALLVVLRLHLQRLCTSIPARRILSKGFAYGTLQSGAQGPLYIHQFFEQERQKPLKKKQKKERQMPKCLGLLQMTCFNVCVCISTVYMERKLMIVSICTVYCWFIGIYSILGFNGKSSGSTGGKTDGRTDRQTDRQTDMPISVQEQEDKPCKIYTYQQPVPKLTKCILFGYFCGSVGDENLMFGLSIIWLYTCFWGLMGRKGVCKKKNVKKKTKKRKKKIQMKA